MTLAQKFLKLDPLGALLIISAVVCLLLALQWGGQSMPWGSATVIGLFIGFSLITALFAWTQWKQGTDAILPWWLLKKRSMLAGAIYMFLFSMPTYIVRVLVPRSSLIENTLTRVAVRILCPYLFPGRQGLNGHKEWNTVPSYLNTTDLGCRLLRRFGYCVRLLCASKEDCHYGDSDQVIDPSSSIGAIHNHRDCHWPSRVWTILAN